MSALIFILILSFLVFIHEAGHFLFARLSKIKVEEFGLGYPPRALALFKDKLGTIYSLNWLPFGGFVRMLGEDGQVRAEGSFASRPAWKRLVVVLAGATINFLFGVLVFGAIYSSHGIPSDLNAVKIEAIAPESPAALAGVPVGITITRVQSGDQSTETKTAKNLINFVQQHRGGQVTVVGDDGKSYELYVRKPEETPDGQGALGVTLIDYEMRFYPWWQMPFRGIWVGLQAALGFGGLILAALGSMMRQLFTAGQLPADVAGPVGIVYEAQKQGFLTEGLWTTLNFAAILSINLAIVNVLPFPALDGGRAVFIFWEMITRRRVSPKIETWMNTVGFAMLLTLIALISFRDIGRVLSDQGVQQWFTGLFNR